jgi:phenylalanyl-tRNA synthetase alpha chain
MTEKEGEKGHIHPVTGVMNELVEIFEDFGFDVVLGSEVEDEWHNFDALNVPKDHPARDMQDTFWLENGKLLRTHTSSVQIRHMEKQKPPFAIIAPGKVFRNEATDRTHEAQFHQLEGLAVAENITLGNLKHYLNSFLKNVIGDDIETRLRPGYFPFVEPGVEIDIKCTKCGGKGCPTCKQSGWIEILGAGMVHPNVLNAVGIDPNKYSGFAFGAGIDRIDDVRALYDGDLRVVNQF